MGEPLSKPRRLGEPRKPSGEEGSGTVLYAGLIAFLATMGILFATVAGFLVAKQQAQSVADMAALAGADLSSVAVFGGAPGQACSMAQQVTNENTFAMSSCTVSGPDTYVVVSRTYKIGPLTLNVAARARAGPAKTQG